MDPPATALAMLRTGELMMIPSDPEVRQEALDWARAAVRRLERGDYRADLEFPNRPCTECPFVHRCPERRQDAVPGLLRQVEQV
jgi:hypothetical protein